MLTIWKELILKNLLSRIVTWFLVFIVTILLWSHIITTYELNTTTQNIVGFLIGFLFIPNISRKLCILIGLSEPIVKPNPDEHFDE